MRDFFKEYKWNGRPFLILGKGPTLNNLSNHDISQYLTIGLNHVCRNIPVHLAHIIDADVINQLGEKLYTNCDSLVIPYYPHVGWKAHEAITLEDLCRYPVLSRMNAEGRIFGYNLSTINKRVGDSPVVQARYFSAEAAVSLLGNLGVKKIRTLGVDGGFNQASTFNDITNYNQERGYDRQWKGIRKSMETFKLDYAPIGVDSPIRIFIGAGDAQLVPALVLKHSILRHATMSVEVTIMNEWKHPMPKDPRNWPRTPFSFQRFMIPEKCNYQGHAIYMDSDMLVFGDVKEMWVEALADNEDLLVMRNDDVDKHRAKYSVFKMNCANLLQWRMENIVSCLDNGFYSYEELLFEGRTGARSRDGFNPDWNSLEEYTEGKTKLLHFTEMWNQPWWKNADHPLGYLWFNELKLLVKKDPGVLDIIQDHVSKGWLLPKCLEVLK